MSSRAAMLTPRASRIIFRFRSAGPNAETRSAPRGTRMVTFNATALLGDQLAVRPGGDGAHPSAGRRSRGKSYRHSRPILGRSCQRPHTREPVIRTCFGVLGRLGGCLVLSLVGGCETSSPQAAGGQQAAVAAAPEVVPANRAWRDVDTAVRWAVSQAEAAIVRVDSPAAGARRWELLTITDQPGVLTAAAPEGFIREGAPTALLVPVGGARFECAIVGADPSGRDEDRERTLLRAILEWKPAHRR